MPVFTFTSVFVQNGGRGALYTANRRGKTDLVGKQIMSEKRSGRQLFHSAATAEVSKGKSNVWQRGNGKRTKQTQMFAESFITRKKTC